MTSCRLNSKFAFCVMRNPEEAAKALNLNGIPYLGNVLKMVRAGEPRLRYFYEVHLSYEMARGGRTF